MDAQGGIRLQSFVQRTRFTETDKMQPLMLMSACHAPGDQRSRSKDNPLQILKTQRGAYRVSSVGRKGIVLMMRRWHIYCANAKPANFGALREMAAMHASLAPKEPSNGSRGSLRT